MKRIYAQNAIKIENNEKRYNKIRTKFLIN